MWQLTPSSLQLFDTWWLVFERISQIQAKIQAKVRFKQNENARVLHLPRVDGVQNSPNNFDLNPVTLTYDLDLWP